MLLTFVVLFALNSAPAFPLSVVTGSSCYEACDGDSTTHFTDLVCNDADYNTTASGQQMQECLTCESTSLFTNATDSDEYWFLFNMKFTSQSCLFDTSSKTPQVAACASTCGPLQPVLDTLWLSTVPKATQYNYCSLDSGVFPESAADCASCLQAQEGSVILGNFINTLRIACTDQPLALDGDLVVTPFSLFDTSTPTNTSAANNGSPLSESGTSTGKFTTTHLAGESTSTSKHHLSSTATAHLSSTSKNHPPNNTPTAANLADGETSASSRSQSQPLTAGSTLGFTVLSTFIALLAICLIAALLAFCFLRRRRIIRRTSLHERAASMGHMAPPGSTAIDQDEKKTRVDSATAPGPEPDLKLHPALSQDPHTTLRYYPSVSEYDFEVPPTPTTLTPTPLPTPTIRRLSIRHAVDSSPPMTMTGQSHASFPADTTIVESPYSNDVTLPATVYSARTTRPPSQRTSIFWSSRLSLHGRTRSSLRKVPCSPRSPPPPKARRIADVAPPLPRVNSSGYIRTPGQGLNARGLSMGKIAPVVPVDGPRGRTRHRSGSFAKAVSAGWNDPIFEENWMRKSNGTVFHYRRDSWDALSLPVSLMSELE